MGKEAFLHGSGIRDVNGTDNFRSIFVSTSVFEDMVCIFRNPPDMDTYVDIGQMDI
jgi:hypothetical protein